MPDHVFNYVECDIPPELTLAQWRRAVAPRGRRRRLGLRTFIPARRRRALAPA